MSKENDSIINDFHDYCNEVCRKRKCKPSECPINSFVKYLIGDDQEYGYV